jgi:hypothetical protein
VFEEPGEGFAGKQGFVANLKELPVGAKPRRFVVERGDLKRRPDKGAGFGDNPGALDSHGLLVFLLLKARLQSGLSRRRGGFWEKGANVSFVYANVSRSENISVFNVWVVMRQEYHKL